MGVEQRDVYLLPPTHDSSLIEHPFIVLSVKDANDYEGTFVGVMITSSSNYLDDFSFRLDNQMFDKPLGKQGSHARMHLITLCVSDAIKGTRINKMKPFYFKQLMKSIGDLIFNYDFTPIE
ncbi:MAG: hypothetical protein J7578_04055 [Chitinophagaceae bacterium]|nr:hypothetical protein [Chitinophagaceae bacterium]